MIQKSWKKKDAKDNTYLLLRSQKALRHLGLFTRISTISFIILTELSVPRNEHQYLRDSKTICEFRAIVCEQI